MVLWLGLIINPYCFMFSLYDLYVMFFSLSVERFRAAKTVQIFWIALLVENDMKSGLFLF